MVITILLGSVGFKLRMLDNIKRRVGSNKNSDSWRGYDKLPVFLNNAADRESKTHFYYCLAK